MVQKVTPLVILTLLMLGSVSVSDQMAPTWNFKIENMTTFAMSENGHYIIVGCEKGPLCEKGQFYVFDQYGNTVKYGCIEGEITVVDITDNGAFFIGTRSGYYYSSVSGKLQENKELGSMVNAVSMSENGEMVIAGTNKEILIFDRNGLRERKEVSWPVNFTAANASGDVLVAGITDRIFLYREATNTWVDCPTISQIVGLTISDDGNTIVCGMSTGRISILDSQLKIKREVYIPQLTSIAMSGDGKYLVCGTRKGEILYLDTSGDTKWSVNSDNMVRSVLISSDGSLVVALSGSILLFDSSGRNLRELKSSETVQSVCLSKSGEILSCSSNGELFFLQLYQESYAWTSEYMLPSRRSIPLDDQLSEVWSYGETPKNVVAADINGDGQNEIVCSFAKEMVVLNSKGKVIWKKPFEGMPRIAALDLTGDFAPEILVTLDGYMRFQVFDGEGQELAKHEFYSRWRSSPPEEGSIIPLWSGNIDNDSSIEVICVLSAGYILEPRGLYAFEYPSFKEEWYYPVASPLYPINFVDINEDGQVEIVAGSNAPCNGRQVGNTDDCHAYVYAVTLQGEKLWTKEIGSGFKRVRIAVVDVNGDGEQEIVGGGWSFENDWGALFILDSKGAYVPGGGKEFDHSIFLVGVADLNNDGSFEIITVPSQSTIALYDHRLRELKRQNASIALGYNSMAKINDIDADGEKEIILTSNDEELLVLNTNLEEEWSKTFPGYYFYLEALVVNLSGCMNDLLILADKLYLYSYENQSSQPCIISPMSMKNLDKEIAEHISKGDMYFERGDYQNAIDEYDLAIRKLMQMRDTKYLPEISKKRTKIYEYSLKFQQAEQFLQEGKHLLELQELQKAKVSILKAREIYFSIERPDKVQEADNLLYKIDQLLLAQEFIEKGEKEESQEHHEEAKKYYEKARQIYENLGMNERTAEVQEMILSIENEALIQVNKTVINITFVLSFLIVSLIYFNRKGYKGENRRTNTLFYLVTVVSLAGVFTISLSSISLALGNTIYILTFSMCLLFLMVLSAYLRRS